MTKSPDQTLDSVAVFPHSYREGARCIGWAKSQGRQCNRIIGMAKMREHENLMARLNNVPLEYRADHPRLEEAVKLLLCYQHKPTDFDKELEDASQKFRDAAEAAKKAEVAQVKQEKPVPQKRPGILRKPTVQFVTPFPLPLTRRGAELAEGSAANSGRSMRRLQASDIPSEPDSESDPESDSSSEAESDVGDVVEIHPLEAWERYDSKWKTIDKSGLEEALPVVWQVPWPVTSGKHWHVSKEEVVRFFNNIADEHDKAGCRAIFLHERMRWCSRNVKDTFGRMFYRTTWKDELRMISSVAKEFEKLYSE
ncbi:hypothetical protein LB503_008978 [Fusarium chuoi]|nr:hypothetical protein LB503_008978 [Fusarium chuoi]